MESMSGKALSICPALLYRDFRKLFCFICIGIIKQNSFDIVLKAGVIAVMKRITAVFKL